MKTKEWLASASKYQHKEITFSHLTYETALGHGNKHRIYMCFSYLSPIFYSHRKTFPGFFCKAHNLLSFQIWGWNSTPVTPGFRRISALPYSQWPMAVTFLLIAKQSSASISLRPHRPSQHLPWRLLHIILGWSSQHTRQITCSPGIHIWCTKCRMSALCSGLYIYRIQHYMLKELWGTGTALSS